MNFNDKPEFRKKLVEIATVVGRTITSDEVDPYFNQLEEYPIALIKKAMDKALRDRDPTDIFLRTLIVTVPEIRAAIDDLGRPEEDYVGTVSSCVECDGTGWQTSTDKDGRLFAWPCKCLYESCKKSLEKKASRANSHRKRIIRAYEYHQKTWGGADEA